MKCPVCKGEAVIKTDLGYVGRFINGCPFCEGKGIVPPNKWVGNLIWRHLPEWAIDILYNIEMSRKHRESD